LITVDNSQIGREAHERGKLPYCIWVYRGGYRKGHMPKAQLGNKILVAIQGRMLKGYVVGAHVHAHYRKHGVPSTDTNNVVLIDKESEIPVGKRIIAPVPSWLLRLRKNDAALTRVLTLGTKFF